jgi:alpha-methylacyl-CoA racemase
MLIEERVLIGGHARSWRERTAMRPLADLRVLDFSTLLPGPLATLLLAEAGADVVKIERPEVGEGMRSFAPRWGGSGANFALLNRGKRSLALDFKNPSHRETLRALGASADIIVEQFRPGVMAQVALDYPTLSAVNPRLIYCSISGYGQTGPRRDVAGHDLNYIGDAGLLALSMGPRDQPTVPPALIADIAAGAYPAFFNILLALRERDRTGRGRHLDIAMTDGLFPLMYWALAQGLTTSVWPGNADALVTGGSPRYRLYRTADERIVAAAPIEQKFWEEFCRVIGLTGPLCDDAQDPAATTAAVAEIIQGRNSEEWRRAFDGRDCCCSIVATLQEAFQNPHFRHREIFDYSVANGEGGVIPALPVPLDPAFRGAKDEVRQSPALGEAEPDAVVGSWQARPSQEGVHAQRTK